MLSKRLSLSNGVQIPAIGIGTFMMKPPEAEASLDYALSQGYRLVDTANAYFNEKAVGRAIRKSNVAREDIFLSTKLWPTVYSKPSAIDETFERLQVDYVDLLFLHHPAADYIGVYKRLEEAYKQKRIRAIGISNFEGERLDKLLNAADIKPHIIQCEAHPYFSEQKLQKALKPYGTRIMGWFPLGHGDPSLMNEDLFSKSAKKYHKSNAQIILRWHVQKGFIVIPGATTHKFIDANIDLFDFELTNDKMAEIVKLYNRKKCYNLKDDEYEQFAHMYFDFPQE